MRSHRARVTAAAVLPLMLLTACGDDSEQKASSSSSAAPASPLTVAPNKVAKISDVKVSTSDPKKPTVKVADTPFRVNKTTTDVTKEGTGKTVGTKDIAYVSYVAVNGTTGKTIDSTFDQKTPTASFDLGDKTTFPGLVKALKGKTVGTEMVVAVPPAEGFGAAGNKDFKITAKDTMLFYVKIDDAASVLTKLEGEQSEPDAGMPTVAVPSDYKTPAKITFPKGAKAPSKLKSQVLIEGKGRKAVAGQQVVVQYTGQIWGGKVFDSSGAVPGQPANPQKTPGQPVPLQIGAGQVIPGWDKTLVNQRVGSRVLMSIPPEDGYGKQGQPQAGIKGTDTLVFVVDILAVK